MTSTRFATLGLLGIAAGIGCSSVIIEDGVHRTTGGGGTSDTPGTTDDEETPCDAPSACVPAQTEIEICLDGTLVRERTCGVECAWSEWTACGSQTDCQDGETITLPCDENGQQPFVCSDGVWTAAGSCVVPDWLTIDAGIFHTCGIRAGGAIECWGSDQQAQSSPPDGKFKAVSAAGYDTCALREDGTLVCWGSLAEGIADIPEGSFDRLNLGMGQGCLMKGLSATCWGDHKYNQSDIPEGDYLMVDSGVREGCGVRTDSTLRCWGYNYYPILDDMPSGAFTTVSIGEGHACALDPDGHPHCWGRDDYGQAKDAPTGVALVQISAGAEHTCGLDASGTLHCWGWNAYGQLAHPTGTFVHVTCGDYHSCALDAQGKATCWGGGNTHGELDVPAAP